MISQRLWEVDSTRGIAIILMVVFNWSFTLKFFNIFSIAESWVYWWLFPRFIGFLFIFLVGVSLSLSYNNAGNTGKKLKYLKRGSYIFLIGVGITVLTLLVFPSHAIYFGVLHLIGLSIMLSIPFLNRRKLGLIVGCAIVALGAYLQSLRFGFDWLLWLGFVPENIQTFDYFPLLPWFGFVLIGLYFGKPLFNSGHSSEPAASIPLSFLGRRSLLIYVIHQPILVSILFGLGYHVI